MVAGAPAGARQGRVVVDPPEHRAPGAAAEVPQIVVEVRRFGGLAEHGLAGDSTGGTRGRGRWTTGRRHR